MRKVILTYGTFDLFHVGHLNLLQKLKELGDYLIVGVSSDAFNESKGKKTIIKFEDRLKIIKNIKYVDMAIREDSWEQKITDIKNYKVSTFGIGDDWKGKFDYLNEYCDVVYLPRTDGISSTELKKAIKTLDAEHIESLNQAFKLLSSIVVNFE